MAFLLWHIMKCNNILTPTTRQHYSLKNKYNLQDKCSIPYITITFHDAIAKVPYRP
jgi:hypothetical protein